MYANPLSEPLAESQFQRVEVRTRGGGVCAPDWIAVTVNANLTSGAYVLLS
jgi:hypothetical protein